MPFPVIGVIVGVAFTAASVVGQRGTNSAIKARARDLQRRVNKQMTQVRVEALDQVRRRSTIGTMAIAEARNQFGFQATGLSVSERLASLAGSLAVDTDAIGFAEEARLDALRLDKVDIASGAESQIKPLGATALGAFATGFSLGSAFDSALAQLSFAQTQGALFTDFSKAMGDINGVTMSAFPNTFQSLQLQLSRTVADTSLKINLANGIASFLGFSGGGS